VLAGGLGRSLPSSFLPDEDQGWFMVNVQLPEAASLQRSVAVMKKINAILSTEPAIQYISGMGGYSMLSQTSSPRNAFFFCSLKSYAERTTAALQAGPIIESVNRKLFGLPGAITFAFPPPAIPGIARPAASISSSRTAPAMMWIISGATPRSSSPPPVNDPNSGK